MAQSTYQSIASAVYSSASTIVINKPSGVVDGDLMVAIIVWATGSAFTLTTLSGWTLIRTTSIDAGNRNIASYYKIASSEGSSYTWTFSGSVESMGAIVRVDTFDSSTPIATSNGAGTNTGGATASPTWTDTVTPTQANQLILFPTFTTASRILQSMSAQAVTTSNPTWTEILDILGDVVTGVGTMNFSLSYANRVETTGTGDSSATQASTGAGCTGYISQKIVIKNQTTFTYSNSDTVTDTDSETYHTNTFTIISDTVVDTDSESETKAKQWTNDTKNTTSWTNDTKH